MKKTKCILIAAVLCLSVLSAALFGACGKKDGYPVWDISAGEEKVYASFSDNGNYGYILTVEGSGAIPDYASVKDTPWYSKSGRVTDIVIKQGVTAVGANAFADIKTADAVLPESVTEIGINAFNAKTLVCAYAQVAAAGAAVYAYSETKPDAAGLYWHYVGDKVAVWETKPAKVLFVGNSFTYYSDVPALFANLAAGAGLEVIAESVTQGSHTLTKFADETDEFGKILDGKLKAADDYDALILQEQSTRPLTNYNDFVSAVKKLSGKAAETQKSCRIYLYSTWGYKEEADARKVTIPEMEAQLRTAYENAAQAAGARVAYVGKAFTEVYNAHKDINDNYYKDPDEYSSSAEKGFALYYAADNKHPSYSGAYLSACVHFATVLGFNPCASAFRGELDESYANALKQAANSAVFG